MKNNRLLLLLIAVVMMSCNSEAKTPFTLKSHYIETIGIAGDRYDVVKDFGMVPNSDENQSVTLQKAIDKVAQAGGGEIIIPAGSYRFAEVHMRSNVHILVDSKAVLKPFRNADVRNSVMLIFSSPEKGEAGAYIENCSIRGLDGKFTVDYSEVPGVDYMNGKFGIRFAVFRMVKNFLVADAHIIDNRTSHCGLVFVPTSSAGAENFEVSRPTNGEIRNCSIESADSGYGLCQLHGAQGLYFEDIFANGGVTLRLESGAGGKYAGVFDIQAKNVGSEYARATVMFSPHCTENGRVLIDGVTSNNSSAAVLLHNGFIDRKHQGDPNAKHGTYSNDSKIYNVHAISGDNSQVAVKELWMVDPVDGAHETYRESGYNIKVVVGRSYAAIYDGTLGEYDVECKNVTSEGFPAGQLPIVYEADMMDRYERCWEIVNSVPVIAARGVETTAESVRAGNVETQTQK